MFEFWTPTRLRRSVAGDKGREFRWVILGVLIAVLVAEQLMSLRMSFHPEATA